ncbi:hypothetical protein MAM1_0327d09719 [Mucor ambiguus]|uniref:Secreted protein n=1 Tax=Mucor ambiguus TaxID=91626 RepID=A0A0C9N2C3_9FUNG|nr:hypothetical protein MAM1_0327d09719 [Mucor ambiguus]
MLLRFYADLLLLASLFAAIQCAPTVRNILEPALGSGVPDTLANTTPPLGVAVEPLYNITGNDPIVH